MGAILSQGFYVQWFPLFILHIPLPSFILPIGWWEIVEMRREEGEDNGQGRKCKFFPLFP
jgi:hypothetical protein